MHTLIRTYIVNTLPYKYAYTYKLKDILWILYDKQPWCEQIFRCASNNKILKGITAGLNAEFSFSGLVALPRL